MGKWKCLVAWYACFWVAAPAAWAWNQATITRSGVLSLNQAIDLAQQQNRGALAARERVYAAQARIREGRAGLLPRIGISVSASQTDPFSGTTVPSLPGLSGLIDFLNATTGRIGQGGYAVQATLSQTVFSGFRLVNGLKVAELGLKTAQEEERGIRQDTTLNVTLAYFNVLRGQGGVDIAREAVRSAEAHLFDARKLLEEGRNTRVDVLRAESQVYELRQQLSRAQLVLATAAYNLDALLNLDLDTPLQLDGNSSVPRPDLELGDVRARALRGRSEIRRLQALQDIDSLTAEIQDHATWPTISVSANVLHADATNFAGQRDTYGFGANLQWNVFDGLAAASQAAQSYANARADALNLEQLRRNIAVEVKQGVMELAEAKGRSVVAEKGIEAAREGLRLASRRYQAGKGTNSEVLDAQLAVVQSENSLNNARFDIQVAQARLNRALGLDW